MGRMIYEFKELIADYCCKYGLPHHWISPNPFTDIVAAAKAGML